MALAAPRGGAGQAVSGREAAFGPHYGGLAQRVREAGLPTMMDTMGSPVHVHPKLEVWANGRKIPAPGGIGIDPAQDEMQMAGLHTHDATGTIHAEGANGTLGQFFEVWGVPLAGQRRATRAWSRSPHAAT